MASVSAVTPKLKVLIKCHEEGIFGLHQLLYEVKNNQTFSRSSETSSLHWDIDEQNVGHQPHAVE